MFKKIHVDLGLKNSINYIIIIIYSHV